MGTKLEYAANLLSSSTSANSQKSSIVDEWGACLETQPVNKDSRSETVADLQRLRISMDRMTDDLHSFESIKKAMLEHDRLFQHQVKELHRLYGVQRMLMNELKYKVRASAQSRTDCRADSTSLAIRRDPSTEVATLAAGYSLNAPVLKPCSTGTTCSGEELTKPGRFDLERPAWGVSTVGGKDGETKQTTHGETKSSFNCGGYREEEADVDLTLSIGNLKTGHKRMKKTHHLQQTHFEVEEKNGSSAAAVEDPGRGEECGRTAASDRDGKRPHWLFQSLSLHKN